MKIVLFDGECNFCNQSVQFIMKRDQLKQFKFGSLQSDAGKRLLEAYNIPKTIDSVVFIDQEQAYVKSAAALKIALHLNGFWKLLYVFIIVPAPLGNIVYDFVAKNRHHLIKNNQCKIPTKQEVDRFL
ncbi:thiol-disulfide oxidoreductase DCC family protein [Lysinibacillus sp. BW-2-10]|uniref:thiol-disulfide oxidoreductase DCC family protein n=1 Tax=Lysinibacillus sp. BW-2-10 TaxID=2590030 RepID=UPI00118133D0|nr:DCC1-like thiol-disulfide oxidoreductase family protein [Lysinibacillus sp. BW-2-10]TSI03235.1 DUF393 domain-containing protein [Lysinibacillus sp. BW-2-10]